MYSPIGFEIKITLDSSDSSRGKGGDADNGQWRVTGLPKVREAQGSLREPSEGARSGFPGFRLWDAGPRALNKAY